MVTKPPPQIRCRSDISLIRILYRSENVCVKHISIILQKAFIRPPSRFPWKRLRRASFVRYFCHTTSSKDGVPSVADLLRKSRRMVGAAGFEPTTTCAQGRCATRLRYAPNKTVRPADGRNRSRPSCASRIRRSGARFRRSCRSWSPAHPHGSRGRSPCATRRRA